MGYSNSVKQNEYNKKWRMLNIERSREIQKKCYYKNRLKNKTVEQRRLLKIRNELMIILGGAYCKHCGFNIFEALQFDHINGGGTKERTLFASGRAMYRYYIKNPEIAKQKLQVLCANCNFIKRIKSESEVNGLR